MKSCAQPTWYTHPMLGPVAILCCVLLYVAIRVKGWPAWIYTDGAPAWVQAVGSILAIFAAAALVYWERREAERSALAEEVRRLQVVWQLVYHSRVEVAYLADVEAPDWRSRTMPAGLHVKVNTLSEIPILDIPDADAATAVATTVEAFRAYQAGIRGLLPPGAQLRRRVDPERSLPYVNALLENLAFAEQEICRCLLNRGAKHPDRIYRINGQAWPPLGT